MIGHRRSGVVEILAADVQGHTELTGKEIGHAHAAARGDPTLDAGFDGEGIPAIDDLSTGYKAITGRERDIGLPSLGTADGKPAEELDGDKGLGRVHGIVG